MKIDTNSMETFKDHVCSLVRCVRMHVNQLKLITQRCGDEQRLIYYSIIAEPGLNPFEKDGGEERRERESER